MMMLQRGTEISIRASVGVMSSFRWLSQQYPLFVLCYGASLSGMEWYFNPLAIKMLLEVISSEKGMSKLLCSLITQT